MDESPKRHPVSEAVRDLRKALVISQQELAFRTKMAIRTIARWEVEQPPRGRALLRLADFAEQNHLNDIAGVFRRAFKDELVIDSVPAEPELRPWIEALNEVFQYREKTTLWDRVTLDLIEAVGYIQKITGRGQTDLRLTELMNTLKIGAMCPSEREMHQLAEQLASSKGLSFNAAYEATKEAYPRIWEKCRQEIKIREEDRDSERQHRFLGSPKGPSQS